MRILVAEYALAAGLGGTYELEGRAMLSTLASSFQRCGHEVIYPTSGRRIDAGSPILIEPQEEFADLLASIDVDAALAIAPDDILPGFLEILEGRGLNLGCCPEAARLCSDKLACTQALKEEGIPVAEIVRGGCEMGCHQYVIKPRFGCGSEGVHLSSSPRAAEGFIATRYVEGLHLSASFVVGERFLPLTVNRQLIKFQGDQISYDGSQVPYRSPRSSEIWQVAGRAAWALGLRGYAGMDIVLGDLPRVVDVNARPTTSMIGIARVMREELADLILRARLGGLPERVTVEGEFEFRKEDLA